MLQIYKIKYAFELWKNVLNFASTVSQEKLDNLTVTQFGTFCFVFCDKNTNFFRIFVPVEEFLEKENINLTVEEVRELVNLKKEATKTVVSLAIKQLNQSSLHPELRNSRGKFSNVNVKEVKLKNENALEVTLMFGLKNNWAQETLKVVL